MAAKMTREEFIAKYGIGPGGTFIADDKGGNAASEVAGQSAAEYFDMYLGPNAKTTTSNANGDESPISWGDGRYSNINPTFDAWDNVNPHPESQRGNGLDEAWKAVGRPVATAAAMYYGAGALNGAFGAAPEFVGAGGAGGYAGAAGDFGLLAPATATGEFVGMGGVGGAAGAAGDFGAGTYAAGVTPAAVASGGGVTGALKTAGTFLKDNAGLTQLLGGALGAASAKDTTTGATSSKDPWAPAQSYLKDNLQTNANMQEYYRQNPFSTEQKTAYQGLLNTLANNNANVPGLLANAGSFGQSKRGQMPAMQGLLSGTQAAPIDWAQYQNIGRK